MVRDDIGEKSRVQGGKVMEWVMEVSKSEGFGVRERERQESGAE